MQNWLVFQLEVLIKRQYGNNSNEIEPFLEERYKIDLLKKNKYETKVDDIKSEFEKYCEERAIRVEDRPSEWKLGSVLTAKGCVRKRLMRDHKRDYYYVGIILKSKLEEKQTTF